MMKDFAALLFVLAILWTPQSSSLSVEARTAATAGVWPSQTYVTEGFTAPDMAITRYGDTSPGYLFLTPVGNGTTSHGPILISDSNELIWSRPSGGWSYTDFRVQHIHNEPYLTYWKGNGTGLGVGYGSVHVLNSSYHEVYNICPSAAKLGIVTSNYSYDCYIDMHEHFITNRGTLVATVYNVTQADLSSVGGLQNGWIYDSLFYEIDLATGAVLFRWRSLDHLAEIPFTHSQLPLVIPGANVTFGTTQALPWDYFHINCVQALADGYLVNSRHIFSAYKVSRDGSIDWRLSGSPTIPSDFTLPPSVHFSWQHDTLIDVNAATNSSSLNITIFNDDNDVLTGTNPSSGLELSLDFKSRSVTLLRKLIVPSQPIASSSQGSYQPLSNNHVLLGYGNVPKTREFDKAGNLVYEAQYGYLTAQSTVASYRSYRQKWRGQPATAPKLAAIRSGSTTKVYLSWNGATSYDSWTIYAGDSSADLKPVASFLKSGFETEHDLASNWTYISAEAKEGGCSLRNTSVLLVSS